MKIGLDEMKRRANVDKHRMDFAVLDVAFLTSATIVPAKNGRLIAIGMMGTAVAVVFASRGADAVDHQHATSLQERKDAFVIESFQKGRRYTREDRDAVDSPELTDEELAQAKPMSEALPELHAALLKAMAKNGPARTKTPIPIQLDDDIAEKLRATGPGWQSRANNALRAFVEGKS